MYSIIVVDDEPLIARSISQIINKVNPSFRVIDVAYDGFSGLAKIKELAPDVVFTDIKMPVMDGLELVKEIKQQFPEIKSVILSGYDEFEYAKRAMHEGVMDYLLKPLNREQLADLLAKLERQLDLAYYSKQLDILDSLIHHSYQEIHSRMITQFFSCDTYLILMLCEGAYHLPSTEPASINQGQWKSNLLFQCASSMIAYNPFWILNGYIPNTKILIVGCKEEEVTDLESLLYQIHSSSDMPIPITSVVKKLQGSITEIYFTVAQMSQFIKENILFSKSMFYNMQEVLSATANPKQSLYLSDEAKRHIVVLFKKKQFYQLRNYLEEIIQGWSEGHIRQIMLEENLKQILQLLLESIELSYLVIEYQNSINDIFANQSTYKGLLEDLNKIVIELSTLKASFDYKKLPINQILQEIKNYVDSNYINAINVQTIALKYGFVPSYLSKLFKDCYKISIKTYILELKMSKATELLKTLPDLPLSDIAALTGFSDQFYFSKVFKQQHQMTPVEFRRMVNNEITDSEMD